MKKILFFAIITLLFFTSCKDEKLSFLDITSLHFPINTLTITQGLTLDDTLAPGKPPVAPWDPPATPHPSKYYQRIINESPWVASGFYGASVEGARPLKVTLESVKTKGDNANADILKKDLKIIGEGRMLVPFATKLPIGEYILSLKISNMHGSKVVNDVFTIVVTDEKKL